MSNPLRRLFLPASTGQYAIGRWNSWLSTGTEDDGGSSLAGVKITRESAIAISSVYACVRVITGTVATLPIDTLRRVNGVRVGVERPEWVDHPDSRNPNLTRVIHFSQVVSSMLFDGNAFTLASPSVFDPQDLIVLDPRKVEIGTGADGLPLYKVRGRQTQEFSVDRILHTPLPLFLGDSMRGISPVEAARQGMALTLASERFGAKLFENGAVLSGVIKVPTAMSGDDQDAMRDRWSERYGGVKNAHKPGILTQGAEWEPLGITPDQAQFLETRRYQAEETARLYGVPPSVIGIIQPGAMSYASVEQQNLQFVTYTLRNIVESIEASYQRLIPGKDTFLKFNMRALLRGDSASRADYYAKLSGIGAMNSNDIRALEDYPPISDGNIFRVPLNSASTTAADASQQAKAFKTLIDAGYPPALAARVTGLPNPQGA